MKFTAFKEFRGFVNSNIDDVVAYLRADLKKILVELQLGLNKLSFGDNFESFSTTVTIASGAEATIRNELRNDRGNPVIPTQRIIVRGKDGAEDIVDGDTDWDANHVYLKNVGSSEATVTVVFIK